MNDHTLNLLDIIVMSATIQDNARLHEIAHEIAHEITHEIVHETGQDNHAIRIRQIVGGILSWGRLEGRRLGI
jgi:hypothetical protein